MTIFRKVSNGQEKVSNTFDTLIPLLKFVGATEIFINNIRMVYEQCDADTPFGQANVMEWLKCSKSKATNIMSVLKKANVIEKVRGLGAGKYRFIDISLQN